MAWFSCVSRCLHTVQSPDRWVGGMSSLEVLRMLTFKSDLSQGTSVSGFSLFLFLNKYLAFCCFGHLPCQSLFERGLLE